jgi:hypothetical protein
MLAEGPSLTLAIGTFVLLLSSLITAGTEPSKWLDCRLANDSSIDQREKDIKEKLRR